MWVNWKRFSFAAFVLASLSLLLFGCSDFGSSQTSIAATKTISGVVSDPGTGLPLANATVTAFAVDAGGTEATTPLSLNPTSATSNDKGEYLLRIPADYNGSLIVQASVPAAKLTEKLSKLLSLSSGRTLRCALPAGIVGRGSIPPVMISFATDAAYQYVATNAGTGGFSSAHIQQALQALETFFGPNFLQTPPPQNATDANTSKLQQDLVVSIRALAAVSARQATPMSAIVAGLAGNGLGGDLAGAIKNAIQQATATLLSQGTLPAEYVPSVAINTAISNAQSAPVALSTDTVPPAAPVNLTVTASAAARVDLVWDAVADSDLAGYAICRADQSQLFETIDVVGPNATSYHDFRVLPQSKYIYKVIAFDAARNYSDPSPMQEVTTPFTADLIPPVAPAGLVCKGFVATQVNLQWQPATKTTADGNVIPAASYNVYRDGQFVASVVGTTYADGNLVPLTQYGYYVKAADGNGNLSPASPPLTVRTAAAVTSAQPDAPTALSATHTSSNVVLTWAPSATSGATYSVYRDKTVIASGIKGAAGATSVSYADGAVTAATAYSYTVTASSAGGESAKAAAIAVTTDADPGGATAKPSRPANLAAVAVAGQSVALLWTASAPAAGDTVVAGYDVFRGDSFGNGMVRIATTMVPSFVDTSVASSTSYSYQVKAFSSAGVRSDASLSWGVTTTQAIDLTDTTAPSAPAGLAASKTTSGSVTLTWTASTKATGDRIVAGYLVFRNGVQIADVAAAGYTDTSVSPSNAYAYVVKAYDNPGNVSGASQEVDVTTLAAVAGFHNVFGRITLNGVGLAGVTVAAGAASSTTDGNGYYVLAVSDGTYGVTPAPQGSYQFIPGSRNVTVAGADRTGVDFAAVVTGSLTGTTTYPNGTVIGGIAYPAGTVLAGVLYPSGVVSGQIAYPSGVVVGGISYPSGSIAGSLNFQ